MTYDLLPDKAKFTVCSIIQLATIAFDETSSYWSAPKSSYFLGFHWSPHGCLITIGQHFVTTRVVHLPKRTETSLITESDQSRANHQLLQLCTVRTSWSDSDQDVRVVHSCKSWLRFKSWNNNMLFQNIYWFLHLLWKLKYIHLAAYVKNSIFPIKDYIGPIGSCKPHKAIQPDMQQHHNLSLTKWLESHEKEHISCLER